MKATYNNGNGRAMRGKEADKELLHALFLDGRATLYKLSSITGMSVQLTRYRLRKLQEEGVLKRMHLFVHPNAVGKMVGFAAFTSSPAIHEDVFATFRCLERTTVFGFASANEEDLRSIIGLHTASFGTPVMSYIPNRQTLWDLSQEEFTVLRTMSADPRTAFSLLAKSTGLRAERIKRRFNALLARGVVKVIPIVDLERADIVLFAVITKSFQRLRDRLAGSTIFSFSEQDFGVVICMANTYGAARRVIEASRETDPDLEAMIVIDYDFGEIL
ncbi:MAG: Lrp/AsnC family transcriptional regulator [Methanomassiliicoccales archaeon]